MSENIVSNTKFVESNDEQYSHVAASTMMFQRSFDKEAFVKTISEDIYDIFKVVAEEAFVKAKMINHHVIPFLHRTFIETVAATASKIAEFIVCSKNEHITGLKPFIAGSEEKDDNCILFSIMFGISKGTDPFLYFFISIDKGKQETSAKEFKDIYKECEPFIKFD